jgi:hypothetical protein
MSRLFPQALLAFILGVVTTGNVFAATYYVAASGSDSNNGTSKSTPWLHAPGMANCASACASTTVNPGDSIILRGGDTWHYSSGSLIGMPWVFSRSGSAGNVIYIGVDTTWYAGSSFARPILTMDNPLSTSSPSSCTYDDSSKTMFTVNANYVTVDNFEFTGKCWSGTPSSYASYLYFGGTNLTASNNYMHGWTVASTAGDDDHFMFSGSGTGNTGNVYAYNVVDGSDSTWGAVCNSPTCIATTTTKGATGWAFGQECYNVHDNVIRHVSNGIQCSNVTIVHDNLMEYQFEPSFPVGNPRHGNVIESIGGTSGLTLSLYNNITRNTNEGVGWWLQMDEGYIFNNVFENMMLGAYSPPNSNALMLSPVGFSSGAGPIDVYVANNTFDGTINAQAYAGNSTTPNWASGSTITWENNHILDSGSLAGFFHCNSPSVCAQTDNGGEVFQTTSAANAQGYTLANNFEPTLGTGATVGAGKDAASSCSTYSSDGAYCSGTSDGVTEASGDVSLSPAIAIVARAAKWDAGAYEFGASTGKPSPPTGLAALVQ